MNFHLTLLIILVTISKSSVYRFFNYLCGIESDLISINVSARLKVKVYVI